MFNAGGMCKHQKRQGGLQRTWNVCPIRKVVMKLMATLMLTPAALVSRGCTSEATSQARGPQDQANPATKRLKRKITPPGEQGER
jgi:hypothetical protein